MAVVALAPQTPTVDGVTPTYTGSLSTSNTYTFPNDGRTFLHVKKSGAGACVATIATPAEVDGNAIADKTVTIPATTGDKLIGPFPPRTFTNADGVATVSFSEITGLTVAVLQLPG